MTIFRILVEGIYCFCWARVGHKGINHSPIGLSFFDRFSYNSFLFWFPIVKEFPFDYSTWHFSLPLLLGQLDERGKLPKGMTVSNLTAVVEVFRTLLRRRNGISH